MSEGLRLLYVGETWNGSSARSLRDALAAIDRVEIDDIGEDQYRPHARGRIVRAVSRIMKPLYCRELSAEIFRRLLSFNPHAVVVYKGNLVSSTTIGAIQQAGVPVINVFPDYSPHAYGTNLRHSIGEYDLVISTKPFHPAHWLSTYGYRNRCVCVPHGYDPGVHFWPDLPQQQDIDVVLASSWRPQYGALMKEVGRLLQDVGISVSLAGPGWHERRSEFPTHWQFPGPLFGRAYGEFVRRGKIVVAPVHTDVVIAGKKQPGDEDTTRTYELAAAGTFFLHRRTPYVQGVYEEGSEGVFWNDARELVEKIRHYLPRKEERMLIASAAHLRAVPAYSVPERAREVLAHIETLVANAGQRANYA